MSVPELLSSRLTLVEKNLADVNHPCKTAAEQLLLVSDYAGRHIQVIKTLLREDALALPLRDQYFSQLDLVDMDLPLPVYQSKLRQFRHRCLLQLLLLEQAQLATTADLMRAWSDCADALILHALSWARHFLLERYGIARDEQGQEVSLFTLAMGKLGGRELNYSSDIDLIFTFATTGMTDGQESLPNQQYFIKLIQNAVQALQNITAEGFVFRVDLRLRPHGDSGALVLSLAAMETYYQEQGRDWERYAMVKARVIDRDLSRRHTWFDQLITPFVYRRYVDFGVIESLRSMKAMIEREVQLNPRLDDIKRGKGGIREIEFIIQNVQLIRGGRIPELREQNALLAMTRLKQAGLLPRSEVMRQAYLFLRRLENKVQSLDDQQTHSLPQDPLKLTQVVVAMGYDSIESLLDKLHQYQRIVSHSFHAVLGKVHIYENDKRLLANQLSSLWQGHIETTMAVNLLTSLGFEQADRCYQMIHAFRHGPRCRRLGQSARMRLDQFMVRLLTELTQFRQTDELVLQVIHLLDQIIGRSSYLALLTENPDALRELLFWFSHSPYITSLLVQQPFLLEVLLDQSKNWRPESRSQLEKKLAGQLAQNLEPEAQEEQLRQFKLTNWLMAARAELYKTCSAVRIGQFLADVAQVIVTQVFQLACVQLMPRHPGVEEIKSHFAVIAYGKLGSREINYTSDLDLVFLYDADLGEEALVTRLTQKMVHMLTVRSQSGVLFSVDTRLRPSGAAGLLVSNLDAFIKYQKEHAWIWEHQALLKARVILGNRKIRHAFFRLKQMILSLPRNNTQLLQEVVEMRAKIARHQETDGGVKNAPGGLLDMEFLIQFLLLHSKDPIFARSTHTLSQIKKLLSLGILNEEHYHLLCKAYATYHDLLHYQALRSSCTDPESMRMEVARICHFFWSGNDTGTPFF